MHAPHLPHALIVDCTANSAVADHYADWLARGIHVVTPNKQAGGGDLARYRAMRAAAGQGARFRYEATVGAGLPIITTLRDLVDTGDELIAVEGIFSGTLAWLFNRYDGSVPYSTLVHQAREAGYTEPDPRDDLGGLDVARKLVILAREAGRELSLADVKVEGLVPESLREVSREAFLAGVEAMDAPMAARLAKARARRPRAALRRAPRCRRRARGAGGTGAGPRLRAYPADRQRGAVHHAAVSRQSAGGAGAGRGAGGDGGGGVRGRVARCGDAWGRACELALRQCLRAARNPHLPSPTGRGAGGEGTACPWRRFSVVPSSGAARHLLPAGEGKCVGDLGSDARWPQS